MRNGNSHTVWWPAVHPALRCARKLLARRTWDNRKYETFLNFSLNCFYLTSSGPRQPINEARTKAITKMFTQRRKSGKDAKKKMIQFELEF